MANRTLSCCLGFVASIAVVCGGGWYGIRAAMGTRLNAELTASKAKARVAGLYLTVEELRPPALPDDRNAAPDYRRAFAFMKAHGVDLMRLDSFENGGGLQLSNSELDKLFKTLDPAFTDLESGAKKPHLDWNRDWSPGWATALPELTEIRRILRCLTARAKTFARRGDSTRALADVRVVASICRQLGEEPSVFANETRMDCEAEALRALMAVVSIRPFDQSLLDDARSVVDSLGPTADVDSLLRTEVVVMLASMKRMEGEKAEEYERGFASVESMRYLIHRLRSPNFRAATSKRWLDAFAEMLEARRKLGTNLHQWSKQARMIEQARFVDEDSFDSFVAQGTAPSAIGDAIANQIATRRAATWLIDSLQAAAKSGAHGFMDVNKTTAPPDPFVPGPMQFAKRPKYMIAYSVGPDEIDSGGDFLTQTQTGGDVGLGVGDLPRNRYMGGPPKTYHRPIP